ncbi:MAG: S-layer homology domain-containing protein, partial [Oscillospiraceae bacterium]
LVLALVMSMSLVTISNAAYSDKADIDLKEAVDVLSAVGVFEGSDGKFDPKANLTREQAAKLVAYLQLGQKSADALVGGNKFTDVAANRWSAGYVDYCATTGVVAGVGNGQFNPTGSLTALQFGKMLLVCLGYDATTENLTGSDWQINTSKLMASAKLLKGLDSVKANDVITREQAAQMMLNAIKAPTVEYDTKGSTITIGGTVIGIGGSKATYVTATVAEDSTVKNIGKTQLTNTGAYTVELGEKLFSNLKLNSDTDAFERPVTVWTLKAEKIGSYANTPDLTYTAEVKLGTIYSDLGTSKKLVYSSTALVANDTDKFAYYADGTINASLGKGDIAKGNDQKVGGNGVLIEVYYDDVANTAKVVEINTYGGEVTSARAKTASKDANVTVTPLNAGKGGNYETEDFKVDDIVAYNYSTKTGDAGVKNVVTAEKVTGELTGYTAGKSVVVGGTTYKFNKAASIDVSALAGAIDNDVTLALDKYGYVLNVNTDATSTNYAVVLKYKDKGTFDDAKAELLFTDGTTKTVELKDDVDKKGAATGTDVEYGAIVSYTITNKGKYDLKVLENATTEQNEPLTTKGSSTIEIGSVVKANGKTIFLVATKSGNSDTVYTSYTGIANVPTIKAGSTAAKVNAYVKSGSTATVVYIDATDATTSVESSTKDVVFVKGSSTTGASYDTKKGTFYTYDAIVNGEITKIDSADKITSYALYTSMATDENGVVKLSADGSVFSGTGTDKAANDAIGLNGAYYSYSKDCQVFYIDSEGTISTSSIGGISKDETDGVWFKVTDGDVTTIVIKEAVSAAKTVISAAVKGNNIAVNPAATVDNTAKTIKFTVTGTAGNGDSVEITPTVSAGASASAVTLTYDGTAWSTATITVTAEDGTTADYVVSVA